MTDSILRAQRISRDSSQASNHLSSVLAAEQQIAAMPDADVIELQAELARTPTDAWLYLWLGLAANHRGQFQAAIDAFTGAIDRGCAHWRVGWYIAQTAHRAGASDLAAQACQAVLETAPGFEPAQMLRASLAKPAAPLGALSRVKEFFARQPARTRTFLAIGTSARGDDWCHRLAAEGGWSGNFVAVARVAQAVDRVDVLSIQGDVDAATILAQTPFALCSPQLVAVDYGTAREAVVRSLAGLGYAPFDDDGHTLLVARFQRLDVEGRDLPATKIFTGLSGRPAYNEIEDEFQNNLHGWLGKPRAAVRRIVIVGACYGLEIAKFLATYPRAEIHVFEPSRRFFPQIQKSYAHEPRVQCHRFAVSDRSGRATFHEGSMPGVGSLLPVKDRTAADAWVPFEAEEVFDVPVTTLDEFAPLQDQPIDLLWCDVQGAELKVLRGAAKMLSRCRAIFLEVATTKLTYDGQCKLADLDQACREAEFYLAAIGLCPSGNGTGNAGWLRVGADPYEVSGELATVSPAELPALLDRLTPHLRSLDYLPLNRPVCFGRVDPLELLTPDRFDLPVKYLYGLHRRLGVESDWARGLYHRHIAAFSGGACREGDGSKASIDDYYRTFNTLLDDVSLRGFDTSRSLVPTARGHVLIDGAHRAAACLVFRRSVTVLEFDRGDERFGSGFFQARGLSVADCDAIALQYCRLRRDSFVAAVFPSAVGRDDEVRALLNRHGRIVYTKTVALNRRGARNLIREVYSGESWLGDWANGFAGADGKMEPCFRSDGPVRVFLFQAGSLENAKQAKLAVRELFGLSNHSIHINDTPAQAVQLAQLFFNDNSIHFLNHAEPRHFERFVRHLDRYRTWLADSGRDPEHFCIDGSAVLAAYGLREAQDLDVLHYGAVDFSAVEPEVNSHNADAHHHTTTRDDIVFNPTNHFYAFGVKFASLDVIRRMKAKRNEGKDQRDVALIDECCGGAAAARRGCEFTTTQFENPAPPRAGGALKVVALVPARNEAARLPFCLRALQPYVDAIVYLDDCSDDDSVRVVESLAAECHVEHIIAKTIWQRDEPGDRNALLMAGRRLGGTHFVVLDADEAFTANCARDGYLRRLLLSLRPGETLTLSWIQLWRSAQQYRFDGSSWTYATKAFAFCDDGRATYQSGFIHTLRVPQGLKGRDVTVANYVHGVMHFQFVNWPNLQIKQAWYRCMERIRQPHRTVTEINAQYAPSENEDGLEMQPVPPDWFAGYPEFAAASAPDERRVREVLGWFRTHGVQAFAELDIWRVDWAALADDPKLAQDIRLYSAGSRKAPVLGEAARREMIAAQEHLKRGDVAACRRSIERALAEAPEHPELLVSLANILLATGHPAKARDRYHAALAQMPRLAPAWANLAVAEKQLKRHTEALTALQQAIALDENCPEALAGLGDFHAERGRHREAAGAFRKLAQLQPHDLEMRLKLARALAADGEWAEAEEAYQVILQSDAHHRAAREGLALIERRKRKSKSPAKAGLVAT